MEQTAIKCEVTAVVAFNFRLRKPWAFIQGVAEGRSAPLGVNFSRMSWQAHMEGYIKDHMEDSSI